MNKLTISIGIPVYNEEVNLPLLLKDIFKQSTENYQIKEIIIVSDGSTDNTIAAVKSVSSPLIQLISHQERKGKSARMQEIISTFESDILIFLDADIRLTNKLLEQLVTEVDWNNAGLASVNPQPFPSKTWFEMVINASCQIQEGIRETWNCGHNFLAFKGCCLGLSKDFAKKLSIPTHLINNDSYLYFRALEIGYQPHYCSTLHVNYRSPQFFKDHLKQSARFQNAYEELQTFFPYLSQSQLQVPLRVGFSSSVKAFFKNPTALAAYTFLLITKVIKKPKVVSAWDIAVSTKEVQP